MTLNENNLLELDDVKSFIELDIQLHPSWLGKISGLKADKLLRNKKTPFLYVLREGEFRNEYYVTFVDKDLTVRHTPFVIRNTAEGWCYNNGSARGPFADASIDDVIHWIMHCEKEECTAFVANK